MKRTSRATGIGAAVSSAVFLGMVPVLGKQAMLAGFSPLAVVSLRTSIAALLLLVLTLLFKPKYLYIYPVGFVGCILAGATNGLGSIFYYTGLSRMDASLAHTLYSLYPLFMAFWLWLDHQSLSRLTGFRLLLSIPGIYLLVNRSGESVDWLGAGLMLASALLYALHLLINQRVLYEAPAQTVTLYTLIAMSVTVVSVYALFGSPLAPGWYQTAAPVFWMGLLTFLSRLSLFTGVKHVGGMQTTLLGLSELLITVLLAQLWLGDRLSAQQWIGAALLTATLLLAILDHPSQGNGSIKSLFTWLSPGHSMREIRPNHRDSL
ncbi:MAG: DMT family transporter [Chloroflexi bacterium]|nr:DMT family transporter [Anaerolineaceae bacterium]NMB89478.1 DMT family transporter [Chloroflexota bacterium]